MPVLDDDRIVMLQHGGMRPSCIFVKTNERKTGTS